MFVQINVPTGVRIFNLAKVESAYFDESDEVLLVEFASGQLHFSGREARLLLGVLQNQIPTKIQKPQLPEFSVKRWAIADMRGWLLNQHEVFEQNSKAPKLFETEIEAQQHIQKAGICTSLKVIEWNPLKEVADDLKVALDRFRQSKTQITPNTES